MKTIKIMSIVGMVIFTLSFFIIGLAGESEIETSLGWGAIASMYGIAYAITSFFQIKKHGAKG